MKSRGRNGCRRHTAAKNARQKQGNPYLTQRRQERKEQRNAKSKLNLIPRRARGGAEDDDISSQRTGGKTKNGIGENQSSHRPVKGGWVSQIAQMEKAEAVPLRAFGESGTRVSLYEKGFMW